MAARMGTFATRAWD